jgi:hypothetical protein
VTVTVLALPVQVSLSLLTDAVTPVIDSLMTPTGALVTRLVPIIQPVVDKVNGILVQLNAALGMNLGGADVYGLEAPACNTPALHG